MATAHCYNGFKDLTLQFDGRDFFFPYDKTTLVEDQVFRAPDERQRYHASNPDPTAMLEQKMTGVVLAKRMFNRHYLNLVDAGVVWIGDKGVDISPNRKAEVLKKAELYWKHIVEASLAERKSALAKGGQPDLQPEIIEKMIELNIYDDTYNPRPALDFNRELTEALKRANREANKGGVAVAEK